MAFWDAPGALRRRVADPLPALPATQGPRRLPGIATSSIARVRVALRSPRLPAEALLAARCVSEAALALRRLAGLASARAGRTIGGRLAILVLAVLSLAVLTGTRAGDLEDPESLPDRTVVSSWRSRANPAYTRIVLPPRYPYAKLIVRVAERYSLPPELIAGIIYVESRFNPRAVSHKGAVGLMQLLPGTARPLARKLGWQEFDLFDPETNLILGTYFLKDRLREYGGDLAAALAYYNGGRWGIVSRGQYRNRGYIRDVMHHYRRYDAETEILVALEPPARPVDGEVAVTAH